VEVDRRGTRRWATALAGRDDPALAAAGRTVLSLLDAAENGGGEDPERLRRMRQRASIASGAADHELRAAGRRVLALLDELERPPARAAAPVASPARSRRSLYLAGAVVAALLALAVLG